jgi:DNA-binding XRE family transcriptional regulator/pyrrolidone-carboxylate peptidase
MAGGITVTLTGTGFQPGAEVYFGSSPSPNVTVESSTMASAMLPAASQPGSVDVSLFNPDGSGATRTGGFTYVVSGTGQQAEVLGVSPLAVIEDTESDVTLRGRNLIEAYTNGMLALRGPTRASVAILHFTSSRDDATGIEELTFTVRITATPPLEPLERMTIQVLASRRPGAQQDGIFESSRQMFTVLPRSRPVPLAYSANLEPGKPNLVVVAGRNLEGSTLELGENMTVHMQKSDDRILAGIVTVSGETETSAAPQLLVRDAAGEEVAQYSLSVGRNSDFMEASAARSAKSAPVDKTAAMMDSAEPIAGDLAVTLIPVPDQQIVGPTEEDSAVFNLNGGGASSLLFDWFNFEITILDITFVLPIVHEVHLIPFFDGGSGEDPLSDAPVLAEVGKLLRLRGVGVLVALHVEIIIHIRVVLIIGFVFEIWPFGFFNEFPEYGWAIGSFVIGIRIEIQILILLAFLLALVLPGGLLRVIFAFNLVIDLDFTISLDGRHLHFGFDYHVNYKRIGPRLKTLLLCDGRLQLASENGQTVFPDGFGGHQSFYLPMAAGECCVPWDFDLELVRRNSEGFEETVQQSFRVDFCLNVAPASNLGQIIITSENPEPTGVPPRLVMTFDDQATIVKALSVPVDQNGNPTGAQPEDVRNLGYNVEFFLNQFFPQVLDPLLLLSGRAFPIMAGDNFIHARIWAKTGEVQLFNFWPGSIAGFVISSFIARGLPPAVIGSNPLPVTVREPTEIVVTPTLTFRDPQNPNVPTEARVLFTLPSGGAQVAVREVERYELFETQIQYTLAVKLNFPANFSFQNEVTLKFRIKEIQMRVLLENQTTPEQKPPLEGTDFTGIRETDTNANHFFEGLPQPGQEITIRLTSRPSPNTPIELTSFKIVPNNREELAQSKLVPPGKLVAARQVMLLVDMEETSGAQVADIRQLKMAVSNDETYEEYLRVFSETRALVTGAFQNFARDFFAALPAEGPPGADALAGHGERLWNLALASVQTTHDDRPLYWTRLQSIGALRAYYKRNRLGQPPVEQFEWPSRGLELNGSISFGATTTRKAIVTGFDPFQLPQVPNRSNPSGVIALSLNKRTFSSTQGNTFVRTAVFPVRYRDFDESLIEKAISPNIGSIALLMTTSQGDSQYDVERFASRNRGLTIRDNDGKHNTGTLIPGGGGLTVPPGLGSGPEFIESTLPYERVITADINTRKLPGPQPGPPPYNDNTGFILNQAYKALDGQRYDETPDEFHEDSYKKQPVKPLGNPIAVEGSGGDFLSNEIFYRTALLRFVNRPALPSGHLHVPVLGTDPQRLAAAMVNAAERALVRFLNDKLRLRSLGDVIFPDTPVGRKSAPLSLNAKNETGETVPVASAPIDPPDGFKLETPLPTQASPNAVFSLSFTFSPTAERVYKSIVRVLDPAGEILFSEQLTGTGVALPPVPIIADFSPTMGEAGEEVTISGDNFAGATVVRIGSTPIMIVSVDNNTIVAMVSGPPRIGKISVVTPSGTAVSANSFRVIRLRQPISTQLMARREELGIEPREAARQLGVQTRTYRRWEQGEDEPRTRYHPAIAQFLGHSLNPEPETLGERIRVAREREGLTKSQLAERLGVAPSTINAWEADEVKRPTERVSRLFEDYLKEA